MRVSQLLEERTDEIEGSIADRRASPRSPVPDAMGIIANHMYKIKRALDAGNIESAQALVNGALKIFQSNAQR